MKKPVLFLCAALILFACNVEEDPFVRNIESALSASSLVKLSTLVDFDEVCVFSQDDSDEHIALDDMKAYLQKGGIQLFDEDDLTKNPHTILLFIKEKKGWVYVDQSFRIQGLRYGVSDFIYEGIRKACYSSERAVVMFANNRLKVGDPPPINEATP